MREFRVDNIDDYEVGQKIGVDIFQAGEKVDVTEFQKVRDSRAASRDTDMQGAV